MTALIEAMKSILSQFLKFRLPLTIVLVTVSLCILNYVALGKESVLGAVLKAISDVFSNR